MNDTLLYTLSLIGTVYDGVVISSAVVNVELCRSRAYLSLLVGAGWVAPLIAELRKGVLADVLPF